MTVLRCYHSSSEKYAYLLPVKFNQNCTIVRVLGHGEFPIVLSNGMFTNFDELYK